MINRAGILHASLAGHAADAARQTQSSQYQELNPSRMIDRFGSGIWEKHHLAERRVSRALGMTDEAIQDTSPAINLPTRVGGGFKSMSAEELATYQAKFGRDPVTHRGPNGIKEAIDEIWDRNGFPDKQTLTGSQKQTLINELRSLYAEDPRFSHLKLWPATRDWLKRHFSGGSLTIPD